MTYLRHLKRFQLALLSSISKVGNAISPHRPATEQEPMMKEPSDYDTQQFIEQYQLAIDPIVEGKAHQGSNLKVLQTWVRRTIFPIVKDKQQISSTIENVEHLYFEILKVMQQWDCCSGQEPRTSFDTDFLRRLFYEVYRIDAIAYESIDPVANIIYQIVIDLISGDIKSKNSHIVDNQKAIPRTEVDRVIQSRTTLIPKLGNKKDMSTVRKRTTELLDMWIKEGALIEIPHGRNKLLRLANSHTNNKE